MRLVNTRLLAGLAICGIAFPSLSLVHDHDFRTLGAFGLSVAVIGVIAFLFIMIDTKRRSYQTDANGEQKRCWIVRPSCTQFSTTCRPAY